MRRITFVALFASIFILSAAVQGQEKFSAVVTDAGRWQAIDLDSPMECTGAPEECAVKMLTDLKIDVGSEPNFSVYRIGEVDNKIETVVFVSNILEDDEAILGKLYRLELTNSDAADKSYSLEVAGQMYQCMEGPVGWRNTPCQ